MEKKLPAILFLLSTPISIGIFIWLSGLTGSEVLGIAGAIGFFMASVSAISIVFNKKADEANANETNKTEEKSKK